jgi:hypothetical protein
MSTHDITLLKSPDDAAIVEAEVGYTAPSEARLRTYTYEPPAGELATNVVPEPHVVAIRDMHGARTQFTLDAQGFQLLHRASAVHDFWNEDEIRTTYYREAEALLREVTGAARVHIFDHTLRRRVDGAQDRRDKGPRQPAGRVHVDQTERSGRDRVRFELPDEADALLAGRVQIINLWRPINAPAFDAPLALCDAASVAPQDLVEADLLFPKRAGEIYLLTYNPAHRWFYARGMRPDDVLLIKCYDSANDGRARFVPHGAFIDPTAPHGVPPRESIELRAMVFHPH